MTKVEPGAVASSEQEPRTFTIEETARLLGLHYMTVYRYVRLGRLPARYRNGRWHIEAAQVERIARPVQPARRRDDEIRRLTDLLLAGDATGAWSIVENLLMSSGPADVYLDALAPTLARLGTGWAGGEITVAEEHRATAVALGIVGRLSPMFSRPGRRRAGRVLLAGAEGDPHAIPLMMVADLARAAGFDTVHLGANVPVSTLVETAKELDGLVLVGISVSTDETLDRARAAIAELAADRPDVRVVLGGPAVKSEAEALAAGATAWAPDASRAAELFSRLADGR